MDGPLATDVGSVMGLLKRLHFNGDNLSFENASNTFSIILRNDSTDSETLAFEMAFATEDVALGKAIERAGIEYKEEPGTYVIDSWSFEADTFCQEDARVIMAALNRAYLYKTCPCGGNLIKDDAEICYMCHLRSDTEKKRRQYCSICREEGFAMHMKRQACCMQYFHARCIATWNEAGGTCPLCRAS